MITRNMGLFAHLPYLMVEQVLNFLLLLLLNILTRDLNKINASVDDVCSPEAKRKIENLIATTNETDFTSLLTKDTSFYGVALTSSSASTFDEKEKVIKKVLIHYTVSHSVHELSQFMDGMEMFGILRLLRAHPSEARELLQNQKKALAAHIVDDLLTPEMSVEGSNKNEKEKTILYNWSQFLEDLEQSVPSHSFEGLVGRKSLLISDVLVFVTGCENIPPLIIYVDNFVEIIEQTILVS